jgi:hypothetical protein
MAALISLQRKLTAKGTFSSIFSKKQKAPNDVRSVFSPEKERRIFGVNLDTQMERQRKEQPELDSDIPSVITKATEYLLFNGVSEQGLFRVSANYATLMKLRDDIENGSFTEFSERTDIDSHTVACLLKMFFRELPDSLLTGQRFDDFLASAGRNYNYDKF